MYTIVLAMALAGSADAPACCWANNCCGCTGWGFSWSGCCGCYGGGYYNACGCCGTSYYGGCYGGTINGGSYNTQPAPTPMPPTGEKIPEPKKGKDQARASTPATIIVSLPANAKLTVNGGYITQQTSSQRVLMTPPMQPGQEFTYTLVAEATQDGQPISQTQKITVRPGQQLPVSFTFNTVAAAASD